MRPKKGGVVSDGLREFAGVSYLALLLCTVVSGDVRRTTHPIAQAFARSNRPTLAE